MDLFEEVQDQINWAKTRIDLGDMSFRDYVNADALAHVVENDPHTGKTLSKLKLVKSLPVDVKGHFRNAIVDLKHSFDMSLNAAAKTLGFQRFNANYPWADTEVGFEVIISKRQRKIDTELPQILIDEIRKQKPYSSKPATPGTDDLVREVAKMANDKHTIGMIVTAEITSYTMTADVDANGGSVFLGGSWDPEKKELVLAEVSGRATASYNYPAVEANIFFKRTGFVGEVPAKVVATIFAERAEMVLQGFKTVCAAKI